MIDLDTWIISDTHFGHMNIIKYCNRPLNHNELMIEQWGDLIKRQDNVLHLGDLAVWYGEHEDKWLQKAAGLRGNKQMLRGNHDKLDDSIYETLGYRIIPPFVQEFNGQRVLFTHAPVGHRRAQEMPEWQWDINIHGHIHNNEHHSADEDLFTGRRYINVSVEVMDYKPTKLGDIL